MDSYLHTFSFSFLIDIKALHKSLLSTFIQIRILPYIPDVISLPPPSLLSGYGAAVRVDECSFHQAVRLDEFDTYRILKVCPSQGEVLMEFTKSHTQTLQQYLYLTVI
jgi:hypothetical protein